MKAFISVIMIFACILTLGSVLAQNSSPPTKNADREIIAKTVEYGIIALRKGDIETYFSLFEEEAIWILQETGQDV